MIPKIIHYCWFGPHDIKKNEVIQSCMHSWRDILPEYEIKIWNESNVNIDSLPPFAIQAYKNKKWAYVADVVRFQKLYEYGGVWLDTDMLILKDFSFLLEKNNQSYSDLSVWGYEDDVHISCGIIAANKNNKIIKQISNFYIDHYKNNNLNNIIAIPKIVSTIINKAFEFEKYNDENNKRNTFLKNKDGDTIKIYNAEYFYPLSNANKKEDYKRFITDKSYAVHMWNYSWQPWYMRLMSSFGIVQIGKAILKGKIRIIIKKILHLG